MSILPRGRTRASAGEDRRCRGRPAARAGQHGRGAHPTGLFAVSPAASVAFYPGRYLTRHGYGREDLAVPAGAPARQYPALRPVASHCTVRNRLTDLPTVTAGLQ